MRASPRVAGQENREAFVRAVYEKEKSAEPSRPSPLLPSHPYDPPPLSPSLPEDAHKRLYTHLSVFASGPKGTSLSLQLVGG